MGGFQHRPHSGIGGGRFAKSFEKTFEVKPGPAAQDRQPAAVLDFGHGLVCQARELRSVKRFCQLRDVYQMVRRPGTVPG